MNESKLKSMFKDAYSFIKDAKFDKAINVYKVIDSEYRKIPKKDRSDSIRKDLRVLYKELKLYLRINIAYSLARDGNLDALKSEMENLHNLAYELSNEKNEGYSVDSLLEYYNKHNQFFLKVYSYQFTSKQFDDYYNATKQSLDSNNLNDSILNLSQLIIAYNKIVKFLSHEEKLELYARLKEVYRDVSIMRTFALSNSRPRVVHGKAINPAVVMQERYSKPNKEKLDKPQSFRELHSGIKDEDFSKLVDFYESM